MNHGQMEKTFGGPVVSRRGRGFSVNGFFQRIREPHLWCGSCTRTFPNGVHRRVDGRVACPYADCSGDVDLHARGWKQIRLRHPNYPVTPWMAVQYPFRENRSDTGR